MRWSMSLFSAVLILVTFVVAPPAIAVDAYLPRNSDAPDALQYALQKAPQGTLVSGRVFWDCYRDLVSNVVLINPRTGDHLAQWNL